MIKLFPERNKDCYLAAGSMGDSISAQPSSNLHIEAIPFIFDYFLVLRIWVLLSKGDETLNFLGLMPEFIFPGVSSEVSLGRTALFL